MKTKVALGIVVLLVIFFSYPVYGQDTCPRSGDGWVKIEGLSGHSYTYTAPDDLWIYMICLKAGTVVQTSFVNPIQKSITIISPVKYELSHVSIKLVYDPEKTQTPDPTATPGSTETPVLTSTPGSTETPDPPTKTPDWPKSTPVDPPAGGGGVFENKVAWGMLLATVVYALLLIVGLVVKRMKGL